MSKLQLREDGMYLFYPSTDEAVLLAGKFGLKSATHTGSIWITKDPYIAAPFFDHAVDPQTKAALNMYAYYYQSSFANAPLPGMDPVPVIGGMKLYGFQEAGIQRLAKQSRGLIGDEMGLGKTVQFLSLVNIRKPRRVLISCPAFLVNNWIKECEKWLFHPYAMQYLKAGSMKSLISEGIYILPYSMSHRYHHALLASGAFDMICADEVHYLKNDQTRQSKAYYGNQELGLPGIFSQAKQVFGMSGTPIPNNSDELFSLMQGFGSWALNGMDKQMFKKEFTKEREIKGKDVVYKSKNSFKLNSQLRSSGWMMRRLKKDVLKDLPSKNTFLVPLEATKRLDDLLKKEVELWEMIERKEYTSDENSAVSLAAHIAQIRREVGIAKAPKVAEYIKYLFDSGITRIVCFAHHRDVVKILQEQVGSNRIAIDIAVGGMTPNQRSRSEENFQSDDPLPRLFIGNHKAAGVGLTLTKSCNVVMAELSWTPGENQQSIDRCHRITQTKQVDVHITTFEHAVDAKVMKKAASKEANQLDVLNTHIRELLAELD